MRKSVRIAWRDWRAGGLLICVAAVSFSLGVFAAGEGELRW